MSETLLDNLFLSVGAMKAGTTWLYSVLSKHPDIHFSHEKEINYFYARYSNPEILSDRRRLANAKRYLRFDPTSANPLILRQRLSWTAAYLDSPVDDFWYRGLFQSRKAEVWVADFSNLYALLSEQAWERVRAAATQVRVVYTLRAPLEQLWSHARFHLRMTGNEARLEQWDAPRLSAFMRSETIWPHADYAGALARIRCVLEPEALHIAWYDDLCQDPRRFVSEIENFLGIRNHPYPESLLAQRRNETPEHPMPVGLAELLGPEIRQQLDALEGLGLKVPCAWDTG